MPTYGYQCQSCASEFDLWQRMSDPPVATCPTCEGPVRRLIFPAGIVFKGSGFYKTDSRRNSEERPPAAAVPASGGNGASRPAESGAPGPAADRPASGKSPAAPRRDVAAPGSSTRSTPTTTAARSPASTPSSPAGGSSGAGDAG